MITYEELISKDKKVIDYLAEQLNLKKKKRMYKKIKTPSTSVKSKSSLKTKEKIRKNDKAYLLSKWKKQITKNEKEKAVKILDVFGIDIYQYDKLMPKRQYLI